MKRLLFILFLMLGAFIFFSFLSKTETTEDDQIYIFFDKSLPDYSIILNDIKFHLVKEGYRISTYPFNPRDISSYIISNPSALYITDKILGSDIFTLKKIDYLLVKVAVTTRANKKDSITGKEFDEVLRKHGIYTDKAVNRNRIPIWIMSYQDLEINLKPLRVDGIFPSLENIKNGIYPKVYKAHIYMKDNKILETDSDSQLLYNLGYWIKKSFSIIAGGDIMLARGTEKYMEKFGYEYPFLEIKSEIEKHDVAIANLESPLSERGQKFSPYKGIYFKADPRAIRGLQFCGFDIISLANNHTLDWGIEAAYDTMILLSEKGIQYAGIGRTRKEACKPALINANGTSIAFISYNDIYPFFIHESGGSMVTLTLKKDSLKSDIATLNKRYDVVIVYVHSGDEYRKHPEAEKVNKMRMLIDYGADIVLCSHPHVIQDIEVYRDGLIAYSLGNLIFDQDWSKETSFGLLLEISFLGKKPLYYNPSVVYIKNTQARIIENDVSQNIISSLYPERRSYEYIED